MIELLLFMCLTCSNDYNTVEQKLEFQLKVHDALVINEMYKDSLPKAEPLPERLKPIPYPSPAYPGLPPINRDLFTGEDKE